MDIRLSRLKRVLIATCFLSGIILSTVAWSAENMSGRKGTVAATRLNVRAKPAQHFERIAQFRKGEIVQIVGETEGWYEVIVPSDARAWVADKLIDPDDRINASTARVHSGAGVVFSTYCLLSRGEKIERIGEPQQGWQRITVPEHATGWVSSQYVDAEEVEVVTVAGPALEQKKTAVAEPEAEKAVAVADEKKAETVEKAEKPAITPVIVAAKPTPVTEAEKPRAEVEKVLAPAVEKKPETVEKVEKPAITPVIVAAKPTPVTEAEKPRAEVEKAVAEVAEKKPETVEKVEKPVTAPVVAVDKPTPVAEVEKAEEPKTVSADIPVVAVVAPSVTVPIEKSAPPAPAAKVAASGEAEPEIVVRVLTEPESKPLLAPEQKPVTVAQATGSVTEKAPAQSEKPVIQEEAPRKHEVAAAQQEVTAQAVSQPVTEKAEPAVATGKVVPTTAKAEEKIVDVPPAKPLKPQVVALQEPPQTVPEVSKPKVPEKPEPETDPVRIAYESKQPVPEAENADDKAARPFVDMRHAPGAQDVAPVPAPESGIQLQEGAPATTAVAGSGERSPAAGELIMKEGLIFPLRQQANSVATHALYLRIGHSAYPVCYLKSRRIDLTEWERRMVRVYGHEKSYEGWTRPIIDVDSIQVMLRKR